MTKHSTIKKGFAGISLCIPSLLMAVVAMITPARAQETEDAAPLEPSVMAVVKTMSDHVREANSLSYRAMTVREEPATNGMMLQFFTDIRVQVVRPNKLHLDILSDKGTSEFWYDGKTVTLFDPGKKLYATVDAPDSLDGLMKVINSEFGTAFPSSALLLADPYSRIVDGLVSANEVGVVKVSGVDYYHMAFGEENAYWQLWVGGADKMLPRRLAITYKNEPGAPRLTTDFSEWKLNAQIPASRFLFVKPAGAMKIDFKSASE
jgi:hypothetical protein